ncbi:transposase [Roseomonas gilardii]|uniref:transposase n=1 Tax=Roseomonas gilardii TaxID=257708 RepID=UPI0038D0180E
MPAWTVRPSQLKGGARTGPNPTERGKAGTKRHLVADRSGIPLAFLLSGANTHDSRPLVDLPDAVPSIPGEPGRPRRRPDKLHADKAYDHRCFRRLAIRYDRKLDIHHALTALGTVPASASTHFRDGFERRYY